MKWGKRRGGGVSKLKKTQEFSTDAAEAKAAIGKLKQHGTSSLSNKELQSVISRMNLEQQYSRLNPSSKSVGIKTTNKLLNKVGDTVLNRIVKTTVDTAFEKAGLKK